MFCGAFGLSQVVLMELEERYGFDSSDGIIPREFQKVRFSPHGDIPTVSRNSPNKLVIRHWSIIPPWVKDYHDLKYPTFNARAETIREKATFRGPWKKAQRCVIIASQFYEWKKHLEGDKIFSRTPYTIKLKSGELMAFAGLYDVTSDGSESCTIITTEPNHDLKDIHNRMPVIIAKEDEEKWLNKETNLDDAYSLLQPYPDGELEIIEGIPFSTKKTPKINPK